CLFFILDIRVDLMQDEGAAVQRKEKLKYGVLRDSSKYVKRKMSMIPISDPKRQLASIHAHILDRIETVLMSGDYILGPHVIELEKTIATRFGVSEAVAVASGTDALVLALEAFGIGHGDEVITTPLSFFSTAEAITRVGATPVFADVDETTFNIDPQKVEQQITPLTKAILPVHLFGQPVSMDAIKQIAHESSLVVIEDACQAFGATY